MRSVMKSTLIGHDWSGLLIMLYATPINIVFLWRSISFLKRQFRDLLLLLLL